MFDKRNEQNDEKEIVIVDTNKVDTPGKKTNNTSLKIPQKKSSQIKIPGRNTESQKYEKADYFVYHLSFNNALYQRTSGNCPQCIDH